MNMVRCGNGHFYDADKFSSCPHCGGDVEKNVPDFLTRSDTAAFSGGLDDETVGEDSVFSSRLDMDTYSTQADTLSGALSGYMDNDKPTVGPNSIDEDDEKTIRWSEGTAKEPVVGWLVAVNGEMMGRSFELRTGKNFIGRGSDMDIVLSGDKSVSRSKHAIILFEPNEKIFMVQPGESRELFYLNGSVVLNAVKVSAYDKISIGTTELLFVPFCGDKFSWTDAKE